MTQLTRLLLDARKGGYALPAFNVENMEMAIAIVETAAQLRSPVILQTTPGTVRYAGTRVFGAMAGALARDIPVVMHLDHGESYGMALRAIRDGYSSVMIDGSALGFEDNIALTRRVVEAGRSCGIPVEGELGKVGGKEDDLDAGESDSNTDPAQALEFAERTGVNSLAVAIGTAHGVYQKTPKVDVGLLRRIRDDVEVPLVLHGTTGIGGDIVRECIKAGICKVNYATELRLAYTEGVREALEAPGVYDPKAYGRAGMEKVRAVVEKNIRLCMSQGRA